MKLKIKYLILLILLSFISLTFQTKYIFKKGDFVSGNRSNRIYLIDRLRAIQKFPVVEHQYIYDGIEVYSLTRDTSIPGNQYYKLSVGQVKYVLQRIGPKQKEELYHLIGIH